jgi:signal transduction histidine kinase
MQHKTGRGVLANKVGKMAVSLQSDATKAGSVSTPTAVSADPRRRGRIGNRLFSKYVALFVLVVAVALLPNGIFEILFYSRDHKAALIQIQQEQAVAAAAKIGEFIKEIQNQLGWTTQLPWSNGSIEQHRLDALRLLRQVPAVAEFAQVDSTGRERLHVSRLTMDVIDSGLDLSQDPKFTEAVAHKVYYGPVYFKRESEPYMTLAIAGMHKNTGVSIAEVNLKLIWDVVSQITLGKHGRAYVVDAHGRLIADPDISAVLRNTDASTLPQVRAAQENHVRSDMLDGASIFENKELLVASAPIQPLGWTMFIELPLDEAYAPLYAALWRLAIVILGASLFAAAAGVVLARRMVGPIQALRTGAARIGVGDFTQRISIKTGDELEGLADQFNEMGAQLQESYADLENKVALRTAELSRSLEALARQHQNDNRNIVWLRQLAAFLRHEVRHPIARINSSIEIAGLKSPSDAQLKLHLDNATLDAQHVWNLVERASQATDAEAFVRQGKPELIDLGRLLSECLEAHRQTSSGIGFQLQALDGVYVEADATLVKQAVSNLLGNAASFAQPDSTVVLSLAREGQDARIAVLNRGPTISGDTDELFSPFRSTRTGPASEHQGLGLYLVRLIAEYQGGSAAIANLADGSGVEATIRLPIAATPRPPSDSRGRARP